MTSFSQHNTRSMQKKKKLQVDFKAVTQRAIALPAEVEAGHHEYKFTLANITDIQLRHRITQLIWRLQESPTHDEAIYHIGYDDDGTPRGLPIKELMLSIDTLQTMAQATDCDLAIDALYHGDRGFVGQFHFYKQKRVEITCEDVNIAIAGSDNSGKSTMLGVFRTQKLDNGKGLARMQVFNHNHEVLTGHTSSISYTMLSFDQHGEILNADDSSINVTSNKLSMLTEEEVLDRTKRTVTCLDLAGHTKYLKTTMSGMLGRTPDYVCIHISVIQGMVEMTLEHIALALYIGVPIMIVLTKIDLLPSLVSNTTSIATHASIVDIVQQIQSLIHPRKCRIIEDMKALDDYFHMSTEDISALVPIFFLSNVTGQGVDVIKSYFFKIPVHPQTATAATSYTSSSNEVVVRILGVIGRSDAMDSTSDEDNDELEQDQAALVGSDDTIKPLQDLINYTFGTAATSANLAGYDGEVEEEEYPVILIGKVHCGVLRVGDEMFLGPSSSGQFIPFHVSTIQRNKVAIKSATKGQTVTFCLTPTTQVTPTVVSGFGTEADRICQVPVSTRKYRQGTKKRHLRGLVLLDMQIAPKAYFEFEAKMVMVMQPQIKLRSNHQPVVHIGHIRQSVKVISMQLLSSVDNSTDEDGKEHATESIMVDEVTQGQHVLIRLRFAYNPEYIQIGETLIIREDRTRAVGRIVQVYS